MTKAISSAPCPDCDGLGLVRVEVDGRWLSRPCACQDRVRTERRIAAAAIPERYRNHALDDYDCDFTGADPSLKRALATARQFVTSYPVDTAGKGLLFYGSIGVGKTHLAVGVLRELIQKRGVRALFCDYRELLKSIQNSYNPQVHTTELELLQPIFNAEVLLIDDLGAQKPSEWLWDTVALILNSRYNEKQTTIITTNYPDLPAAADTLPEAVAVTRGQTLGDRIGDRMRSRLNEMCIHVEMKGKDFRETVRRARFF